MKLEISVAEYIGKPWSAKSGGMNRIEKISDAFFGQLARHLADDKLVSDVVAQKDIKGVRPGRPGSSRANPIEKG